MIKRKVFVSFRFDDGHDIKEDVIEVLENEGLIIDKSEDVDRSHLSEESIREYLFKKLKDSSITIVLITPKAVNYKKDYLGNYDDWLYDELRYSLYNRENNPINGVIALYTDDSKKYLIEQVRHSCEVCNEESVVNNIKSFDNLIRPNMMNVKKKHKRNDCVEIYDGDYDSYISLISLNKFLDDPSHYLEVATEKRKNASNYEVRVRMK